MELLAFGFNAWNQLQSGRGDDTSDPQDVFTVKCILEDDSLEILWISLSSILIKTSSQKIVTGESDGYTKFLIEKDDDLPQVAIAGNDQLVALSEGNLLQYPSPEAYIKGEEGSKLRRFDRLQQIEANQTSFTILTPTGTVYTWGDGRYESCLARPVSEQCPASTPCLVEDLLDLPTGKITKISSGGYVTAAITAGNDLYIWGGRPGQPKLLEQMEGYPTPVDLEGLDILDVAVGDNHLLALSTDHRLFVVGAGGNGQLGFGREVTILEDWKEMTLPLKSGQKIVGVHAGYKTSFLLVT